MEQDHLLALIVVFIILIYLFYNPEKCIRKNKDKDKDKDKFADQEEKDKKADQTDDSNGKNGHEKPKKKMKKAEDMDQELVAKVKNNITDVGLRGLRR